MVKEEWKMSVRMQAEKLGFHVVGSLRRIEDLEPSHLYQYYLDEADNRFIVRRGILTIVAADGTVW